MFQLVLSEKLRSHLANVAAKGIDQQQPVVFDAATNRMARMPGYRQDAKADNVKVFHGREVRQGTPRGAKGGDRTWDWDPFARLLWAGFFKQRGWNRVAILENGTATLRWSIAHPLPTHALLYCPPS